MKPPPLGEVFQALLTEYGPQHWWPADEPFEVMVGAVLTQNTAWTNVERAIENLKHADLLHPQGLLEAEHDALAQLIRPAGYFNVKTRRLKHFCRWYLDSGVNAGQSALETSDLRRALLAVNGVGPETADDILLYAFQRAVFVIDAYTRRLFGRLGCVQGDEDYEVLRAHFEQHLDTDIQLYNEYHALIVRHAKEFCKTRPLCGECCLTAVCREGNRPSEAG